jgi:hypothetical protein
MQERFGEWIETYLNAYRDSRDLMAEAMFHVIYGSPLLQAVVGLKAQDAGAKRMPGKSAPHFASVSRRIDELKSRIADGGPREAALRALLYIRMPDGAVDERSFNLLRRMRDETGKGLTLAEFKTLVREQFLMLLLDERRAVAAIPAMVAQDRDMAGRIKAKFQRMIEVVELRTDEAKSRLAEIQELLNKVSISEPDRGPEPKKMHIGTVRHMRTPAMRHPKH